MILALLMMSWKKNYHPNFVSKSADSSIKEYVYLVAKLHPVVSRGFRRKEDEFFHNKDTGLLVCPEGHMALKKAKIGRATGS